MDFVRVAQKGGIADGGQRGEQERRKNWRQLLAFAEGQIEGVP